MRTPSILRKRLPWLLLSIVAVATGCARHETGKLTGGSGPVSVVEEQAPPDVAPPPQVLGPGDQVELRLVGRPDSVQLCTIGPDARLYFEPCLPVSVGGLTLSGLASAVETAAADYFKEPVVEAHLVTPVSVTATVLGEVTRPGPVALRGGERVLDLIARAGGPATSESAINTENLGDLAGALYVRNGELLPVDLVALVERGDQRQNIQVHPNDYLYIPASYERLVYVLGFVGRPGIQSLRDNQTLARTISAAGGYTREAWFDDVIIIRGSRTRPVVAHLDLEAIVEGRKPDVKLKPGDIVYVPGSTSESFESLAKRFNSAVVGTVASSYAAKIYTRTRIR